MDLRVERTRLQAALAAGDDRARVPLGVVQQQCGEHAQALDLLEHSVVDARAEVERLIALGVARRALGRPDAGVSYRAALVHASTTLPKSDPLVARASWELGSMTGDADLIERAARIWIACAQPAWAIRAQAFVAQMRGEPARELYSQALVALDHALGDTDVRLVDVLLEAAVAFDPGSQDSTGLAAVARAMRERAVRVAYAATGLSQRTIDTLWTLAIASGDATLFDGAHDLVRGDAHAEAVVLYAKAAFLDRDGVTESGLHVREQVLIVREDALGADHPAVVALVGEVRQGWDELGRPVEAEAFLRRCRDRAHPASWVFRNLTYSIASIATSDRVWREFLAAREAACAPGSPELEEARAIVAKELRNYDGTATAVGRHVERALATTALGLARPVELAVAKPEPIIEPGVLDFRERVDIAALRDGTEPELRVTVAWVEGEYPRFATNARMVFGVLADRPLRSLAVRQVTVEEAADLVWFEGCPHVDYTWPRGLERLELAGVDLVHSVKHGALLELVLDRRPICPRGAWDLPALHTLAWSLEADSELDVLDPIWTQPLPALRVLSISASFYGAEGLLARSEVVDRLRGLEQLTLPASALGDDPIDTLLDQAGVLRHLAALTITGLDVSDPRMNRLRRELPGALRTV